MPTTTASDLGILKWKLRRKVRRKKVSKNEPAKAALVKPVSIKTTPKISKLVAKQNTFDNDTQRIVKTAATIRKEQKKQEKKNCSEIKKRHEFTVVTSLPRAMLASDYDREVTYKEVVESLKETVKQDKPRDKIQLTPDSYSTYMKGISTDVQYIVKSEVNESGYIELYIYDNHRARRVYETYIVNGIPEKSWIDVYQPTREEITLCISFDTKLSEAHNQLNKVAVGLNTGHSHYVVDETMRKFAEAEAHKKAKAAHKRFIAKNNR